MHRFFMTMSRVMAYLGGIMLSALVLLTCLSVIGRSLNGFLHGDLPQGAFPGLADWLLARGIGPINGDFELIEAGVAFSIFAFLPLCQITGSHASVDIFTARMSARANRALAAITEAVFAFVLVLIAVQLAAGMQSKINSGQTTFLLQFPVWWAYALSLTGAVAAAVVAVWMALVRCAEAATGRVLVPHGTGAEP